MKPSNKVRSRIDQLIKGLNKPKSSKLKNTRGSYPGSLSRMDELINASKKIAAIENPPVEKVKIYLPENQAPGKVVPEPIVPKSETIIPIDEPNMSIPEKINLDPEPDKEVKTASRETGHKVRTLPRKKDIPNGSLDPEPPKKKFKRPPAEYSNKQHEDLIDEILSRKI